MTGHISRRAALAGAAASIAAPNIARAAWADRPVTLVHGFAAGGNADVVARIVADALTRKVGTQFIVEPRPGAGGSLSAFPARHGSRNFLFRRSTATPYSGESGTAIGQREWRDWSRSCSSWGPSGAWRSASAPT